MMKIGNRNIPTKAGRYYWSTWKSYVDIYTKRGGRHLYVVPPGGVEIRVTPRIAGSFIEVTTT